jgi:hypothetical protein
MCDQLSKLNNMAYRVDPKGMNVLRPADCLLQLFENRPETVTIYTCISGLVGRTDRRMATGP